MDLNKAVEHCWDRRDYPEIISDDAGLDISIPRFITRGPWKEHNRPRRITLNVTTYIGTSWNAVHYYGNLDIEGISFSQEDSPNTMTMCSETYDAEEKNPLAGGMYHIELVRPVTREEIEEDNSRWWGYEIGSNTNAFHSPEDVIALAKEVCKARFKGNWNDYPTKFRRGSCCIKKYHQTMNQTLRGYWYIDDEIPIFTGEGRDYIEKLI